MIACLVANGSQKLKQKQSYQHSKSHLSSLQSGSEKQTRRNRTSHTASSSQTVGPTKSDNKALKRLKRAGSYLRGSRANKSPGFVKIDLRGAPLDLYKDTYMYKDSSQNRNTFIPIN